MGINLINMPSGLYRRIRGILHFRHPLFASLGSMLLASSCALEELAADQGKCLCSNSCFPGFLLVFFKEGSGELPLETLGPIAMSCRLEVSKPKVFDGRRDTQNNLDWK